jgi:hypothetical protein
MSKRMPKLECEVHLDAPVDLQQLELHGFIALESTQVKLTAVYWDTHERLLGWGHTVRHRAASGSVRNGSPARPGTTARRQGPPPMAPRLVDLFPAVREGFVDHGCDLGVDGGVMAWRNQYT